MLVEYIQHIQEATQGRAEVPVAGAWRLHSDVVENIQNQFDPEYPYMKLFALMGGTEMVVFTRKCAKINRDAIEEYIEYPDEEVRTKLLEVFTTRLAPPSSAAGLFVVAGIHPAWGIHTAYRWREGTDSERLENKDLFPDEAFGVVQGFFLDVLEEVFREVCEHIKERSAVVVDVLSEHVNEYIDQARRPILRSSYPGLPILVSKRSSPDWACEDFVVSDLIEDILVPLGFCAADDVSEDIIPFAHPVPKVAYGRSTDQILKEKGESNAAV